MKKTAYILLGALTASVSMTSCGDDFLDTEYTANLNSQEVGEAAVKIPSVFLNGMWSYMVAYQTSHDTFGFMSCLHAKDMMGQDIAMAGDHWFIYDYGFDNRMENYRRTQQEWLFYYTMISKANEIISSFPNGVSTVDEKGLVGQALAVRGMCYTYLVQVYSNPTAADGSIDKAAPGVPLMYTPVDGKSTDEIAAAKGRNTVGDVLAQAEKDLVTAVEYLGAGYDRGSDKNNIDVHVANGLLARYYLLTQQWQKAADAANAARSGYTMMSQTELFDGFMNIGNHEWMWGFKHNSETQTTYASFFSHISNLAPGYAGIGYAPRLIDANLYNLIPDSDARKGLFNGPSGDKTQPTSAAQMPYAALKFGNTGDWTMHYVYMRAAEMVLIEAESYARLGDGAKAAETLKELMLKRQSDWAKVSVTVEDVLLQRRIELWGEGFGYFDLKRNNLGVDRSYDGSNHLTGYKLVIPARDVAWTYQIPQNEIQENELITEKDQNK